MSKTLGLVLRDAYLAVDRAVQEALAQQGFSEIRPGHHVVLRHIGPDGERPVAIAERAQVSRQAIAKVIDDLERMGVVRRDPDPRDGRGVVVRLTERGLSGLAVGRQAMDAIEARLVAELGPRRWRAMRDALERLGCTSGWRDSSTGPV
jgi:DNA-binding MarR family transcriptional regulator